MLIVLATMHECIACIPISIIKYLQISVNDILLVQILNCQEHLGCVESGTFLWKPVDNMTLAIHSNVRLCHIGLLFMAGMV